MVGLTKSCNIAGWTASNALAGSPSLSATSYIGFGLGVKHPHHEL